MKHRKIPFSIIIAIISIIVLLSFSYFVLSSSSEPTSFQPVQCTPPSVSVGGTCTVPDSNSQCTPPSVMISGQCVIPDDSCEDGEVSVNGFCQKEVHDDIVLRSIEFVTTITKTDQNGNTITLEKGSGGFTLSELSLVTNEDVSNDRLTVEMSMKTTDNLSNYDVSGDLSVKFNTETVQTLKMSASGKPTSINDEGTGIIPVKLSGSNSFTISYAELIDTIPAGASGDVWLTFEYGNIDVKRNSKSAFTHTPFIFAYYQLLNLNNEVAKILEDDEIAVEITEIKQPISCATNQVVVDGQCQTVENGTDPQCTPPEELIDDICQIPDNSCQDGQVMTNGVCVNDTSISLNTSEKSAEIITHIDLVKSDGTRIKLSKSSGGFVIPALSLVGSSDNHINDRLEIRMFLKPSDISHQWNSFFKFYPYWNTLEITPAPISSTLASTTVNANGLIPFTIGGSQVYTVSYQKLVDMLPAGVNGDVWLSFEYDGLVIVDSTTNQRFDQSINYSNGHIFAYYQLVNLNNGVVTVVQDDTIAVRIG